MGKLNDKSHDLSSLGSLIVANSREAVWIIDYKTFKFKYISPSIVNFWGITHDMAINKNFEDIFTKKSFKRFQDLILKKADDFYRSRGEGKKTKLLYEFEQINNRGEIIYIELQTVFYYNPINDSMDIIGNFIDISKRKKKELEKDELINKLQVYEKELSKVMETLSKQNEALKSIATTDELTGIFNRHYFDEIIPIVVERAERYHEPLSVILFDIDHFKKVNDTWGHDVGDEVLMKVSATVRANLRKLDTFVRWGGEEFIILLPQTNLHGAQAVAEKLRVTLEKTVHAFVGRITSSFSVAERHLGEPFDHWFKRLDEGLYQAKDNGRNTVVTIDNSHFAPLPFSKVKWKSSWSTGNIILDKQRRYIIELANSLIESAMIELFSSDTEKKLLSLIKHLQYHFKYEESFLKKIQYPYYEEQEIYHTDIIQKMQIIRDSYINEQIKVSDMFEFFLEDILFNHFLRGDSMYFKYIDKDID